MPQFVSSIILCLLLSTTVITSTASNGYSFQQITNKDGLPHQQVEDLLQDDNGILWIGTRNGLAKYDGADITTYFHQDNNPNSLPHNTIDGLFQDSKKRIWIGTNKGICRYRPESNDFKRYTPSQSIAVHIVENHDGQIICAGNGLYTLDEATDSFMLIPRKDHRSILSLAVDSLNRLFFSTNNTISFFDPSLTKITQINPSIYSEFLSGFDDICPLFFDSKNRLWIGRNGKGLMYISPTTGTSKIFYPDEISDGTVRAIAEDNSHNIWIGTENGITVINPNDKIDIIRPSFTEKNALNDNAIYTIICDRNNNIWVGTYFGGINVIFHKTKQFNWIKPGYGPLNLKGKAIRNIIEPESGKLWIASEDGGINIYDCHTKTISQFNKIPSIGNNIHDILFDDSTNTMWIGTFRKGLFAYNTLNHSYTFFHPDNTSGLNSDAIFSIKQQKNGTIWIGTTQGLRYFDSKHNTFKTLNHSILDSDFIYCLLIDHNDNIWVGTRHHGLFHIDSDSHEIIEWQNAGMKDLYITCLYQDSNDTIWIGTNNNGLQYIHPSEMKIKTPDSEMALPHTTICGIIEDYRKQLWVSTNVGLYEISHDCISKFSTENGLPSNQFNFSSAFLAQDSLLYFGSINGLVTLNPAHLNDAKNPFEVYLKHLNINDIPQSSSTKGSPLSQALDKTTEIKLTNEQSKSFNIEYIAISLGNTESIRYQTRLLGLDNTWRDVGTERKFVGSNLPAGTYTLQIRANNTNTNWESAPIKSLKITIQPPFYLSYYAFAIYIIMFVLIIFVILRLYHNRLIKKNDIKIADMQQKKLEEFNQMKFEFFTSVSHELKTPLSLILAPLKHISQHKDLSDELHDKIGTVIRSAKKMGNLIDELITFNKVESGIFRFYVQQGNPIEFIENITTLFKENANERQLKFNFIGENNGESVWFSPLYVESIVNNLLSNAFKFTPAGGNVQVKASIIDSPDGYIYLHIEVIDTGIGIIKEELGNIFNKYYQTKRGHNKNNNGWGLGLALTKNLVTIHKGVITVESKIGEGSTFIVNLNVSSNAFENKYKIENDNSVTPSPYKFTSPNECYNSTLPADIHHDERPNIYTILIVEDNHDLLQLLSEIFSINYNIFLAENGKEAIETISNNNIDCIISDIMMPEMDGFELCKYIKSNISTSHIPIVLLSAKNDEKDVLEGMECGADAYIHKPFDPKILELQIKNIFHNKKAIQDRLGRGTTSISDDPELPQLNKLDQEFIERINELIDSNIDNDSFSIADMTATLGVSRSLLHVKMKTLLNISASEYIRKKRLNKACIMLLNGHSVSETAYSTGFSDPNYFSKSFKKEFNLTPTEYQNKKKDNR